MPSLYEQINSHTYIYFISNVCLSRQKINKRYTPKKLKFFYMKVIIIVSFKRQPPTIYVKFNP